MQNLKNRWAGFREIKNLGTFKHLVVNLIFFCQIELQNFKQWLFKTNVTAYTACGAGNNPEPFSGSLLPPYFSVANKASLLKFNICNIYKNSISKMFFTFY